MNSFSFEAGTRRRSASLPYSDPSPFASRSSTKAPLAPPALRIASASSPRSSERLRPRFAASSVPALATGVAPPSSAAAGRRDGAPEGQKEADEVAWSGHPESQFKRGCGDTRAAGGIIPFAHGQSRRYRVRSRAQGGAPRTRSQASVEDRARARRWRVHRGRVRDRRAASARPAGDQLDRQRVRRVRRDERRLVRLQPRRQRGHSGGDDAGPQPRSAVADPRHRPLDAPVAELHRLPPWLAHLPVQARLGAARDARTARRDLGRRRGHGPGGGAAQRHLLGARDRALRRGGAVRPRPHQRLPAARPRALPDRHRPRHDRARDPRRGRVVGGADLDRGRRLGGAARHLRAGRDRRPRVHRRRHPVDHQRRRRDRARCEVRRRDQPARPIRQRLPEEHPDGHRVAGPARLRHGDRGDPQPDVPAALPRSPPPRGRDLGGALPGRRHHPDRARARRRADVRDLDPRLPRAPADRQARVRVRDPEARPRLRPLQGDRRAPRDRDLGAPGPPRPRAGRPRAREALRLAPGARADDLGAAAQLARSPRPRRRPARTQPTLSGRAAPASGRSARGRR